MKILITGASGFIGQQLCKSLHSQGHELLRCVRSQPSQGEIAVGDIGPHTDWQAALATQPEAVIHLAARVHVMHETIADPLAAFRQVNVEGSLNLARQAAAAGVQRFVYLSSIKVNGEFSLAGKAFKADDSPAPQDAYAISKHEAEIGLLNIASRSKLKVVIVRPPLVYGPGCKANFAALLRWVRSGIPLPLGSIPNQRSMIALENLVDFLALCADRERSPKATNEIFLVSDAAPVSTTELLQKMALAYGRRALLIPIAPRFLRLLAHLMGKSQAIDRLLGSLVIDSTKAQTLLGWRPLVTMEEQLTSMTKNNDKK